MFDFEPTEEQRALIDTARRFARERIIPIAAECDRESRFPKHVFEEAHAIGLVNPTAPGRVRRRRPERRRREPHHRGARVRLLAASRRASPRTPWLSRPSSSPAPRSRRRSTSAGSRPSRSSSPTPRASPRRAATSPACSAVRRRTATAATCSTAPSSGSPTRPSRASTSSSRPRTPRSRHKGIGAFIVERSQSGVKPGRHEDKLGQRASDTAPLVLEDVRVPASQVLAPPGQGFKLAMETFNQTRPDIGAIAVGIMRRCLDECVAYAKERKTFGVPIAQHQLVQAMLAEMTHPHRGHEPARPQGGVEPRPGASATRSSPRARRPSAPTPRCRPPSTPSRSSAATGT